MVKRFDSCAGYIWKGGEYQDMNEEPDGAFVLYMDYEALAGRLDHACDAWREMMSDAAPEAHKEAAKWRLLDALEGRNALRLAAEGRLNDSELIRRKLREEAEQLSSRLDAIRKHCEECDETSSWFSELAALIGIEECSIHAAFTAEERKELGVEKTGGL